MRRFRFFTLITAFLVLVAAAPSARAQQTATNAPEGKLNTSRAGVDVEGVVAKFLAKERAFQQELTKYGFKRDAVLQSIGMGGQIQAEYHRVSRFTFGDDGKRYERVIFFPLPSLAPTQSDLEDLETIQLFVLEASKLNDYKFSYVGKERVDELDTYVFDVAPKVMPDGKKNRTRYFQGRVWIDDQDFQLVKAQGKGIPDGKERFPTFEYYREQLDGRYWFPSQAYADEQLVFPNGNVERVRMRIKFSDYELLRGKSRIVEEGKPGEPDTSEKPPEKKKP